ncbi:MAG: uracil-DNA glycosylase [Spirochaetaceae bacterium 4572_7]|nr:MAG: uracil-DNA glycosylase [Spirochaetaceae bacterium 4572_7]
MNIIKKECKWYPVCPMNFFYNQGKIDKSWVDNYCHGKWDQCIRYQKEEAGIYHSDKMLPNGEIDNSL